MFPSAGKPVPENIFRHNCYDKTGVVVGGYETKSKSGKKHKKILGGVKRVNRGTG